MSHETLIHPYSVVFTNGSVFRRTLVEAISLAHAQERAENMARGMMDAHAPGDQDWSQWRIVIETPDQGRSDAPFPDPPAEEGVSGAGGGGFPTRV